MAPARQIKHAHILLKADSSEGGPNWSDKQIQQAFEVGGSTIWNVRKRFVENGLQDALKRRPQPACPDKRMLTGRHEAYLIALSCGEKPEGRERWSVRLLAHKIVEVGNVEQVGRETIRVTLKKRTQTLVKRAVVHSAQEERRICVSYGWKISWRCIIGPMMHGAHKFVWMKAASNYFLTNGRACRWKRKARTLR